VAARGDRRGGDRHADRHGQRPRRRRFVARNPLAAACRGIYVRAYRPVDPLQLATIRLNYPKIVADAGPCGLWPTDLGPTLDPSYLENRPYWNLGCATQHNLAAMVENPADIAQPRGETSAYEPRRSVVLEKYRKGESTQALNPQANQGKISDVGK
jgi:pilus assembly protein CpaD